MKMLEQFTTTKSMREDTEGSSLVSGIRQKFRDELCWPAAELNTRWGVITSDGGVVTKNAGDITLSSGVLASGNAAITLGLTAISPFKVAAAFKFSQASQVNCDTFFELIDKAGNTKLAFAFIGGLNQSQCRVLSFEETGIAAWENTNVTLNISDRISTARIYEIQVYPDEVRFSQRDQNGIGGRSTIAIRNVRIPDPNTELRLRIRMTNITTQAIATMLSISSICFLDINELPVDLTNTGSASPAESIPVTLTSYVTSLPLPSPTSGSYAIPYSLTATASTNATLVKNSAANLGGGVVTNTSAAAVWLKIFNKNTAPVVGTDTPVLTVQIPAGGQARVTDCIPAIGMRLPSGLAFSITANPAKTDTTAIAAGVIVELIYV